MTKEYSEPPTQSDDQTQKTLSELLDQIEQRANAATPEPWVFEDSPGNQFVLHPINENEDDVICALGGLKARTKDFQFIAAARSDVPALVKALRRAIKEFDFDHVFSPAQERLKQTKEEKV